MRTVEEKAAFFYNKLQNNELTLNEFEANALCKIKKAQTLNDIETEINIVCNVMEKSKQCNGIRCKSCSKCASYLTSEDMLKEYRGMPTLRQIQDKSSLFRKLKSINSNN